MTKQSAALMITVLALVVFGSVMTINALTVAANSCSQTNVQTAINSAASGDTVTVPGGRCTWSGTVGVTITNAIHLQGNGIGSTVITFTSATEGSGGVTYSPPATEATKIFELSGFLFQGGGEYFRPNYPSPTTPITGLKVHDNAFNGATHHAIHLNGMEFGVFYNNTFSTNYISIWSGNAGWDGETYPHNFGSANYPYFEDNTIGNGAGEFVSETGQGGRLVFRHNTISGYACSGCEVFDIHGDQGASGTVSSEYYHNTIGVGSSGTYRWMHHRGGQGIVANNTISRSIGFNFSEYRSYHSDYGTGCIQYPMNLNQSDVWCSKTNGTTCLEKQIHNSFYFNNIAGGSQSLPSWTNPNGGACGSDPPWGDDQYIQQNREYWLPTYGLASALPGSCRADGNTYYGATDTDVIYKCTATNTWNVFYQPYTYPHPLRTGSMVAPPTNLMDVVQ